MKIPVLLSALLLSCAAVAARSEPAPKVLAGIDVLEEDGFKLLRGKRVGLITNQTGRDLSGRSTIDVLAHAPGVTLVALFMPEHGLQGLLEGQVSSGTVTLTDGRVIPLYNSLYGPELARAPTPEILGDLRLDALVFDIQDIGARFYTYSASMGIAMEAAAKSGLTFYVLDRPNPIRGDIIEGPMLDSSIRHITAFFPIPVRHGLTMGELARVHNTFGKAGTKLVVVPLKGWTRDMWYDDTDLLWTRPSPNMPDLPAATMYPGIGCFEATNMAVGRGTPTPFRWIGAPWMKPAKVLARLRKARLPGVTFKTQAYTPEKSVYEGKACEGISITITDRNAVRPLDVFAHLFCALRAVHPKEFEVRWTGMRQMVGSDEFRERSESKDCAAELIRYFHAGPAEFKPVRDAVLLY